MFLSPAQPRVVDAEAERKVLIPDQDNLREQVVGRADREKVEGGSFLGFLLSTVHSHPFWSSFPSSFRDLDPGYV